MCHPLEKVYHLAMTFFNKSETVKPSLEKLLQVTSHLTARDCGLDENPFFNRNSSISSRRGEEAPVIYIPVEDSPILSMGIFIVREGERIPMHDHPKMYGIIKCLYGKLRVSSLTKLDDANEKFPNDITLTNELKKKLNNNEVFLAGKGTTVEVASDSQCCYLEPTDNNIHQVESVGGAAAFLDILAPPYNINPPPTSPDQEVRDCNYYQVVCDGNQAGTKWVAIIPPPNSFYCDTMPYKGPTISKN